jgi:large subunit ribosomal protein L15
VKAHDISPAKGSRQKTKRVGRGTGSGLGKTSGRGHKGQKARSGGGVRRGFEGGQMPLSRRIPKRGFTNIFKKSFVVINVGDLGRFSQGTVVTPDLLQEQGLINLKGEGLKVLGNGEISHPLVIQAQAFSRVAREKIEAAGGKAEVI